MSRLEDRFRDLDRLKVPDLLPEIHSRPPGPDRPLPRFGERLLTVILAFAVAAAGVGVAAQAFLGRDSADEGVPSDQAVSVVGRADDVGLECEVRLLTRSVSPGQRVDVTFIYRNVGDRPLKLALLDPMSARLLVRDEAESLVWDTHFGGYNVAGLSSPYDLEPGAAVRAESGFIALWGGRLTLEPVCNYLVLAQHPNTAPGVVWETKARGVIDLAHLHVDVLASGETPTQGGALDRALAETGGLFDQCRPDADGSVVLGSIPAPGVGLGGDVPSLEASCRADIRRAPGFAVVDLLFASPPDVPLPSPGTEGALRGLVLPEGSAPGQIGRWTFLVTEQGTRQISPDATSAGRPEWSGLITVVRGPRDCPVAGSEDVFCHAVVFSLEAGEWVRGQGSNNGFEQGISFFVPDPRFPVDDPIVWGSGESAGLDWSIFTVRTGQGVELGYRNETTEVPSQIRIMRVPDPCPVDLGSTGDWDLTPSLFGEGSHLLVVGPIAPAVASVEVVLKSGRSTSARIVRIDDTEAPFDAFVAFIEGDGDDELGALIARDDQGQVIEVPEDCSSV